MATKVVMEALSPTMEEGRLVKWNKNEGDAVKSGDVLAEVETDKAVMELVARADGVLRKRLLAEGSAAPVGQLLGVIASADENIDALVGGAGGGAPAAAPAPVVSAPAPEPRPQGAGGGGAAAEEIVGQTRERAGASSIPRSPQESQGDASMPPQEKVAGSRTSQMSAPVRHAPQPDPATEQAPHAAGDNGGRTRTSPLARRLASERGVDLEQVQGSGPGGRIIKRDIEAAVAAGGTRPAAAAAPAAAAPAPAAPARVIPAGADFQDVPLTQIRKTIARRLAESIGPIPTFYLTAEFDLGRVTETREAMAAMGPEFKVSVNDVVLKAVATALSQHPEVNAHWLGDKIRYFNRVHLGMAVATDDGLIVPVIFDAHTKRMSEISREAKELAKRARERKLKPEEYTGSTFSVSNLGMFGIDQFTAIINPPESAILAIGSSEDKLVVENGEPVVRKRMRVTMSCDHRVIDGAVGAKFLQTLRRLIENPLMLVY
ncbi:MAG TPA: pyruvate dehydrogenase complex dihydrolipoamide acetyltransferase [Gemmatimonadaceae bacterium]|nr:pyruvate dehydrogenase complex dihydrolipoamide acetyltransferase [Gemmatimonadaceae bacterium]